MTGSAKQSSLRQEKILDCFVAALLAMTVKGAWQFAIVGFAKDSNHPASQQLGITGTGNFHINRFDAGG
jgi:hypothetical protein